MFETDVQGKLCTNKCDFPYFPHKHAGVAPQAPQA